MSQDHSQRAHAKLSASGSKRWMTCTPSANLEQGFADTESDFAKEGTLAHEFAEMGLQVLFGRMKAADSIAVKQKLKMSEHYSDEMPEQVDKYVQYVKAQYTEAKRLDPHAMLFLEQRFDLREYIEEGFGTGDSTIIGGKILEVPDLKYGKGVRVNAKENPQLMLYGLGALNHFSLLHDIETVRLTIVQPRLDHIDTWEISAAALIEWGETQVKPAAIKAYAGEGDFVAGEHCRFCKAKTRCRALADHNLAAVREEFTNPALLSDDEVLEIYEKADGITKWLSSIGEHVLAEALNGKQWANHKLVEGRSNRVITDEARAALALAAEKFTEEQIYNKKLKGIGDLEKLAGKAKFEKLVGPYVQKPQGKPTLVHESDKRPALRLSAAEEFAADLENESIL